MAVNRWRCSNLSALLLCTAAGVTSAAVEAEPLPEPLPGEGALSGAPPQLIPGLLEDDLTLSPGHRVLLKVGVGQAKFLRFNCLGGPANALVSLSTISEEADPMLLMSLDPDRPPSIGHHDVSSVERWRGGGSGGLHYLMARAVGPAGGILGVINMRHFSEQLLDAILEIQCSYIVAFDFIFWDHLVSAEVCPVGLPSGGGDAVYCSARGRCARHGACVCDEGFAGLACESRRADVKAAGHYSFEVQPGQYQYFRVPVDPSFAGGYLEVRVSASQPLVVLVSAQELPTRNHFDVSNFEAWVRRSNSTVLKFQVGSGGRSGWPQSGSGRHLQAAQIGNGFAPMDSGPGLSTTSEASEYVYVGVLNHRKAGRAGSHVAVWANATVKLKEDSEFSANSPQKNWVAEFYNPYQNLETIMATQKEYYPDNQRFVFHLTLRAEAFSAPFHSSVNLYRDRMTLLRISNKAMAEWVELGFDNGAQVKHMLSAAGVAAIPKTLFDFDQVHAGGSSGATVHARGEPAVWLAIFGATNGLLHYTARAKGIGGGAGGAGAAAEDDGGSAAGFAMLCVLVVIAVIVVLCVINNSTNSLNDLSVADDRGDQAPISERFMGLLRSASAGHDGGSSHRTNALSRYVGSEGIDRAEEERYLHRGGHYGDDGI